MTSDSHPGPSKLARTVQYCSSRLIVQEQLTKQIAECLSIIEPAGVGVQVRAQHSCMSFRGPCVHDTWTTTTCLLGVFKSDPSVKAEFLGAVRSVL